MSDSEFVANSLIFLGLLPPSRRPKRVKWPNEHLPQSRNITPVPERSAEFTDYSRPLRPSRSTSKANAAGLIASKSRPTRTLSRQSPTPLRPGMTGMLDIDTLQARRGERTFAGSYCVICDEPLEHTLRGERFLQLSCSHVTHEACFYEFIRDLDAQHCPDCGAPLGLDSGRGGNIVDIGKLGNIVRSLQPSNGTYHNAQAPSTATWDTGQTPDGRYNPPSPHTNHTHNRSRSGNARGTTVSSMGPNSARSRRHGHDTSIDTDGTNTLAESAASRERIPPPTLVVRSEYPTLTRSKQAQSLTCLITVEIPDTKSRPRFGEQRTLQTPTAPRPEPTQAVMTPSPPPELEDTEMQPSEELDRIAEELQARVDNWHGLDFSRFGHLRLHSKLQVGKDRRSWQELECYLFSEMLICVKDKRVSEHVAWEDDAGVVRVPKATMKGAIMIKKHLNTVEYPSGDDNLLTLNLSVPELPLFHLQFLDQRQLHTWQRALADVQAPISTRAKVQDYEDDGSGTDDENRKETTNRTYSSTASSRAVHNHNGAADTDYSDFAYQTDAPSALSLHAPIDLVVVVPLTISMQGMKIDLLRDSLRFLLRALGPRDRLGLVTFGSSSGVTSIMGMTHAAWPGWPKVLESLRPATQRVSRGDLVEGANVAMDVLMQRKHANLVSSVFVISDSSSTEAESVDFVVSRAEAAKVTMFSFGLGLTHKPDAMIELSTRTEASYTYVKDWMMLRECLAGCLGALQTISHQDVRLKLRLPDGSPAKFSKISGSLQVTKRAAGRDAECSLGDLRFGDKRDILVQLTVSAEAGPTEAYPQDAWDSIVSGLEALGGPVEFDSPGVASIEEVPVLQADLVYGDILRQGVMTQSPRPSLLAVTILNPPSRGKNSPPDSLPIPPHAAIVQRRMELLTSDMLTRALTLVARNQSERAHHLLQETRSILKGLGKGGLPPLPSRNGTRLATSPSMTGLNSSLTSPSLASEMSEKQPTTPGIGNPFNGATGVNVDLINALDTELDGALEWINHPTVFLRDARKAVLQSIGVISSQRAYTFRTSLESLWADRVSGIRDLSMKSQSWRGDGDAASIRR